MTTREISTFEYTCDRCGYVDSKDYGWERRRGIDFCPGCSVDFYRFLNNQPTQMMRMGDGYRHPDPEVRDTLKGALTDKGLFW